MTAAMCRKWGDAWGVDLDAPVPSAVGDETFTMRNLIENVVIDVQIITAGLIPLERYEEDQL